MNYRNGITTTEPPPTPRRISNGLFTRLDFLELVEKCLRGIAGIVLYGTVIGRPVVVFADIDRIVLSFAALVFVFVIGTH
jgi:hypothetical protein